MARGTRCHSCGASAPGPCSNGSSRQAKVVERCSSCASFLGRRLGRVGLRVAVRAAARAKKSKLVDGHVSWGSVSAAAAARCMNVRAPKAKPRAAAFGCRLARAPRAPVPPLPDLAPGSAWRIDRIAGEPSSRLDLSPRWVNSDGLGALNLGCVAVSLSFDFWMVG